MTKGPEYSVTLLTASAVADQLGVSVYSVMSLARSYANGNPRGLRGAKVLREWRFTEEDIALFLEANRSPAPRPSGSDGRARRGRR